MQAFLFLAQGACCAVQVRIDVDSGGEYLSVTNVVERKMLLGSMPEHVAAQYSLQYPEPPDAVALPPGQAATVAAYAADQQGAEAHQDEGEPAEHDVQWDEGVA